MNYNDILNEADNYFSEKFFEHGTGPQVSDWNSYEAQTIRFEQLSRVLPSESTSEFSLCDFGCGLGDYEIYVKKDYPNVNYTGIDVSQDIINKASQIRNGNYICGGSINTSYDYIVSSGIFNAKQSSNNDDWKEYILSTINMFAKYANKGFAFNCLTSYSDEDKMKDYLYYANPLELFDYCKKNFSRNVALLHDYDIYDFTIIVRQDVNMYERSRKEP